MEEYDELSVEEQDAFLGLVYKEMIERHKESSNEDGLFKIGGRES